MSQVDQLRDILRDAKQKISGKKAELIERVVACGLLEAQYQQELIAWKAANAGTLLRERASTEAVERRRDLLIAECGPEPISEAEVINIIIVAYTRYPPLRAQYNHHRFYQRNVFKSSSGSFLNSLALLSGIPSIYSIHLTPI